MKTPVSDIAFTPAVKSQQERFGSRAGYASMEEKGGWKDEVSPDLKGFIAERDSFYLATTSSEGHPYIQHRGGEKGFLKVLDEKTLAFADFSGNRQYVTLGNLSENNRAFIFLMDYENQRRVKVWGRARVVEDDASLTAQVTSPDYKARPERVITFTVEAWDVNCPKHIRPRFTQEQVDALTQPLTEEINRLKAELLKQETVNR
ncbi:MAG: pyridoxamine 5'-phosphate oxidase family protein [Nitrospinae bacterium]|nr:pyridoxamine 5'-phosphate oxidase family protein [Nitrospinota bacterium]MBL7020411.1 pyridoxamine 5'-phosphate oxidase family protein [Nitrospinaceae bacterium]